MIITDFGNAYKIMHKNPFWVVNVSPKFRETFEDIDTEDGNCNIGRNVGRTSRKGTAKIPKHVCNMFTAISASH